MVAFRSSAAVWELCLVAILPVALALSVPTSPHRPLILTCTCAVVIFSVLVEGLTFPRLARWAAGDPRGKPA